MRTIVITDVHGMAKELEELLAKLNLDGTEDIITLGDITDKGPEPIRAAHLLMGVGAELTASNHDDRYVKFLKKKRDPDTIGDKKLESKSVDGNKIRELYREILNNPDVAEYLLNKKAFIQRTIAGNLITMVHAGVAPDHDLYTLNGRTYNEMIRVRYLDKDSHKMVRIVRVNGSFPDEAPTWRPETDNVVEWQHVYDGRYGTIIHGHNIVQDVQIWQDGVKYDTDPGMTRNIENWDVLSIDTGAFQGNKLTALIISDDGSFSFEQVNCEVAYSF